MNKITAEEFDKKFDNGEDIKNYWRRKMIRIKIQYREALNAES